ncbi:MAG TPA: GDSL-type esterase/lipase family protein [Stenotrophomonas sp.]|jgi:lysophospholipase L1-like esterase
MQRWIIAVGLLIAGGFTVQPVHAQVWVPAWTASPAPDRKDGTPEQPEQFVDQTVRQDMRLGTSANALRFRLSNELGDTPLKVVLVSAQRVGQGKPVPVTVGGRSEIVLPIGAALLSDPVPLAVPAMGEVALTVYYPEPTKPVVRRTTVRVASGRAAQVDDAVKLSYRQNVVSAVLAQREHKPTIVVALGDSITEGATATRGSYHQWPELLGARLQQACPGQFVVLNQGISGNKVMDPGRSHSALSRLDRDAIAVGQADQVILFEGINDIRHNGAPTFTPGRNATDMKLAYAQIADRLHAHGIKAIAATMTPFGGSERYEPVSAGTRDAINGWMRGGDSGFDALLDFDRILRDPAKPQSLPDAITRDHLHPNDEGYQRMAAGIDLSLFGCKAP